MTLIPNTYNGLVSAVKALAEDDSTEFAAYIPTAIYLAEQRLIKEIDTEGLHAVVSTTANAGTNILAKPSGYRVGYDVSFNTSSGRVFLTKKTDDYIKDYWPQGVTSTGRPKYYADKSNTQFIIAPTPSSAHAYEINYLAQVSTLSNSVQSNYYTDYVSDGLFYATMSNMSEFMKDYGTQGVWENKYDRAMQGINNEGRRGRREDGTAPNNPNKARNTLMGDN